MTNCVRIFGSVCFCLIFMVRMASYDSLHATPNLAQAPADWKTKQLSLKGQKMTFIDVIDSLSKLTEHNILVDDEPLTKQADIDATGDAKSVLDAVLSKFDYIWTENDQGVLLLTKRFENPDELPQMNLLETRRFMKSVLNSFQGCEEPPQYQNMTSSLTKLYSSFTPEQLQILRAGKLNAGSLSDGQTDILQQAVYHISFGDLYADCYNLSATLQDLERGSLVLHEPRQRSTPKQSNNESEDWRKDAKNLYYTHPDLGERHAIPLLDRQAGNLDVK